MTTMRVTARYEGQWSHMTGGSHSTLQTAALKHKQLSYDTSRTTTEALVTYRWFTQYTANRGPETQTTSVIPAEPRLKHW